MLCFHVKYSIFFFIWFIFLEHVGELLFHLILCRTEAYYSKVESWIIQNKILVGRWLCVKNELIKRREGKMPTLKRTCELWWWWSWWFREGGRSQGQVVPRGLGCSCGCGLQWWRLETMPACCWREGASIMCWIDEHDSIWVNARPTHATTGHRYLISQRQRTWRLVCLDSGCELPP